VAKVAKVAKVTNVAKPKDRITFVAIITMLKRVLHIRL